MPLLRGNGLVTVRILAEHLHVPAERNRGESVLGFPTLSAPEDWSESDREAEHLHADALGGEEVPELVHEHQNTQGHDEGDRGHDRFGYCHSATLNGRPRPRSSR